jgi:Spy/CpxP family protein refolding chaperone
MKNFKVFGLLGICLILFARNSLAQGWQQRGQQMQAARMDTLKSRLNLTDKQVTKIQDIFAKSREKMARMRDENMGDRDAMMKAVKDNNDQTYSEIEKVLTPEQNKIFQGIKANWIKRAEERRQNFGQRNRNN